MVCDEAAICEMDGATVNLHEYVVNWIKDVRDRECSRLRTDKLEAGAYQIALGDERGFEEGRVRVNGIATQCMVLEGMVEVRVVNAVVVLGVEVGSRGRAIKMELNMPEGLRVSAQLVQIAAVS